jgi:restriction system protein
MARRSQNLGVPEMLMEMLEALFKVIPPWSSIPIAFIGFVLTVVFWDAIVHVPVLQIFGLMFGTVFAAICLIAGFKGFISRNRQQQFLRTEIDMEWVRGLSWRGFEHQLAEVYRQQGYTVEETGGGGADGGIDLKLFKNGRNIIVQCKHWKTWKVNVKPVRELFGVMIAEKADAAIFITSGQYTSDALKFAKGKPIELISQNGFLDLVRRFQKDLRNHYGFDTTTSPVKETIKVEAPPNCPKCRVPMKLCTARKGKNAGSQFWGCSRFPHCRSIINFST